MVITNSNGGMMWVLCLVVQRRCGGMHVIDRSLGVGQVVALALAQLMEIRVLRGLASLCIVIGMIGVLGILLCRAMLVMLLLAKLLVVRMRHLCSMRSRFMCIVQVIMLDGL